MIGLALFVRGLEMGLFPIGETMAHAFARKGSLTWLLLFAAALGFGTTVAEPALIAVAEEAAEIAAAGKIIDNTPEAMEDYADGLRLTVAISVGFAYDSGGVTTSTITVPLVTALGVGLASSIKGRNPMIDGFGLIAFASLTPMIFVMGYGMLI